MPSKYYRELLGSAICVFNSNNAFVIENILRNDTESSYNWYQLIDMTSGQLKEPIATTITQKAGTEIATLFAQIIDQRNRIIHSFQITDSDGEQRLATKDRSNHQYVITESYLLDFINSNQNLSSALHKLRGY